MRKFQSTVATITSLAVALQAPLVALAADSTSGNPVARRCDRLAAPIMDEAYSGPREPAASTIAPPPSGTSVRRARAKARRR